jgi:hypothetical protein
MRDTQKSTAKESGQQVLLSYLTPKEKHQLVGSFVVENFWDIFIQLNTLSIDTFRSIAKKSIQQFIKSYQDVWDYVVGINLLDDLFLTQSIAANKTFKGLSLSELKMANKLLSLSLYSELEKDCLMALNKTILTELADDLKKKYRLSEAEFQLLMTPSFETFFTKYHFDHFEYAVNSDLALKEEQRKQLIANYHANDSELFSLRFADMHFPDGSNLSDLLALQRNTIADRSAKKTAFIADRDDLKAFEKLLEYDNFLDFKYRYNLEACPEYYIRKMLFAECQSQGIFVGVNKPLVLTDTEFIDGVNKLIGLVETKYIIELDLNGNSDLTNFVQLPIAGSIRTIVRHLKQGSPCLVKYAEKKGLGNMVIVGYEGNALLAKTSEGQIVQISVTDLESFDQFTILQKYSEEFMRDVNESIEKFIARPPFLSRKIYENAF